MPWESVIIERQSLYDQIWAAPMTTVAKRYSLSDVGLRKICVKLQVPVPPRGYWARVAAGQKITQPALRVSKVEPTFTRSYFVPENNAELEKRLVRIRAEAPPTPAPEELTYVMPSDATQLIGESAAIERLSCKVKEKNGLIDLTELSWADLSVSPALRWRAVQLLDKFAFFAKAGGATFILKIAPSTDAADAGKSKRPVSRPHLTFHGYEYFIRISEHVLREEIHEPEPARPKPRRGQRWEPSFVFREKKFSVTPTGRLKLSICSVVSASVERKIEDTAASQLDARIPTLVLSVEAKSLTNRIEQQIQHEKALETARKTAAWQERKQNKDGLLKRLAEFEAMARDLDRATSLRRFIATVLSAVQAPAHLKTDIDLLSQMADWLDPVCHRPWPEVDDVPDRNPHSGWWACRIGN